MLARKVFNPAVPGAIGGTTPAAGTFTTLANAQGAIISGTYTPTLFNTTNVAASTAYVCQYSRVGDVVTVSGRVDIDTTAAPAATALGMSLPIASNLTASQQVGGAGCSTGTGNRYGITGDTTNDRAVFEANVGLVDASNDAIFFSFTYRVL